MAISNELPLEEYLAIYSDAAIVVAFAGMKALCEKQALVLKGWSEAAHAGNPHQQRIAMWIVGTKLNFAHGHYENVESRSVS